jgi:cytoskeletal protein CcmA (bactofilin family)
MQVFTSSRSPESSPPGADRRAALSVLAEGLRVIGEIESQGVVKIEGCLEGGVRGSTQVLVAPGGSVVGAVVADEVIVSGRVDGDVTATSRIEITRGGAVHGDVTAPRVAVQEGGEVNGRFRMERRIASVPEAGEIRKTA